MPDNLTALLAHLVLARAQLASKPNHNVKEPQAMAAKERFTPRKPSMLLQSTEVEMVRNLRILPPEERQKFMKLLEALAGRKTLRGDGA